MYILQHIKRELQMLAQVCAYYTLDESGEQKQGKKNIFKKPNHTQILSVIILLGIDKEYGFWQGVGRYFRNQNQFKNKLIEILTGEGKSLVLGFCSLTLALLGCDVDVICYSNYLSERDNRDFRKLFEIFGVSDKITYGTFKNQAEKFLSNKLNVRKATLDVIKNSKLNKNNKKINEASRFKVMLIDEVDIFFNQSYYGQTYNPVTSLQTPEIEKIIRNIWDLRNQTSDEIVQNIQSSQNYDELIEQYPQFADLFKNHISNLAQDVKKIESHKKQSNYVVKNNKIGYRQNDSTISFTTYKGYQTLFAYFYENSLGNIDDESLQSQICLSLNCGKISYALLPDQYSAILGVTGTLSSLNSQMKKALLKYNFTTQIFTPSMFGDKKLDFKEGDMVKLETDQENQYLQIQEVSAQAIKQQQSVLIFFKDSKSLSEYHESSYIFLPKEDYIVVSEHENSDDVDFEVKRVTRSGQIGLFVREYGRGTDFICLDPKVNNVGGVVVIQTFLSDNKTEEIQIKGRTARQGQQGKYYLILNEKDIQNDFKIEEEQLSQWKNNQKLNQKLIGG